MTSPAGAQQTGAYIYSAGAYTAFNAPGSIGQTTPVAINNAGQIIGYDNAGAFLDSGGVFTTIDVAGSTFTAVAAINNDGEVLGRYYTASGGGVFTYSGGVYTDLNLNGLPTGINDAGQITGYNNTMIGFVYDQGTYTSLGFEPTGINDSSQIIGGYGGSLIYTNGVETPIDPPGATQSVVSGINDAGQVVGSYFTETGAEDGFIYSGGVYTTLSDPLTTGELGGHTTAIGINGSGVIVGSWGTDPVPEPAAWAIMLVGMLGLGATLRARRRAAAV